MNAHVSDMELGDSLELSNSFVVMRDVLIVATWVHSIDDSWSVCSFQRFLSSFCK